MSTLGPMGGPTMGIGETIRCMEKAPSCGLTVEKFTMESIETIRSTVMERLAGLMGGNTLVSGRMVSSMALVPM